MTLRLAMLLLALAGPLAAEPARVISGEHADFTRLVVQLPEVAGWTVGRTAMGYGFATDRQDQPGYDLSTVWNRIPRTRLQALRVDEVSGALTLTLACSCHVIPFEYQPGMIVLDIKDGAPPPGSVFESPFDVSTATGDPSASDRPSSPGAFDWLEIARGSDARPGTDLLPISKLDRPSLDPLKMELLEQISRGAADGVVKMALPGKPPKAPPSDADIDWARIRIGELPGLAVRDPKTPSQPMQPDGAACSPDAALAISDWGANRPPLDLLAEARGGLYGEFDAAVPEAVLRSVRLHLYLGFGAEALQYAALLPDSVPDSDLLVSMARLIDDQADPDSPFMQMTACDSNAALWAALAHDRLPVGADVNTGAIVRGFLALPPHLRLHLGARLAELLLERDPDKARMIRDAMARSPYVAEEAVALLDARAELHAEQPEKAIRHAEAALVGPASGPEALIALVDAHFLSSLPLPPERAQELQAWQRELGPSPELDRAEALAMALSGQMDEAMSRPATVSTREDLWRLLAVGAPDDVLLFHAILPAGAAAPEVAQDIAQIIAERLLDLGFPEPALVWLGNTGFDAPADRRLLAGRAELARGDARQALLHLSGLEGEDAAELRARAQTQLGALDAARTSYAAAGQTDEATRLAAWSADWKNLPDSAAGPWAAAASLADGSVAAEGGPLARGTALLGDSAATRDAVSALLSGIPEPGP